MSIFWLQQRMADVPTDNAWLSAPELLRLSEMQFAKRRNDWRLGRWTAKRAIAAYLGWRAENSFLNGIEIRPASSGAPEAFIAGQRADLGVSLSHRAGQAIAALAPSSVAVGCDLEKIELRISAFVTDYFTPEEQLFVEKMPAPCRPGLVTLLWSAKESALKALGQGLRLDTRSISVNLGDGQGLPGYLTGFQIISREGIDYCFCELGQDGWRALQVRCRDSDRTFYGWWQTTGGLVGTLVEGVPSVPPILLNPDCRAGNKSSGNEKSGTPASGYRPRAVSAND